MSIIEKLKDKSYVRAFGLMKPEEQECYRKVKAENCFVLVEVGYPKRRGAEWHGCLHEGYPDFEATSLTYIIKPDYQPGPEYIDLEITKKFGDHNVWWLGVWENEDYQLPHRFTKLHELPSLPNFEGFIIPLPIIEYRSLELVAREINDGVKVFARFRKD